MEKEKQKERRGKGRQEDLIVNKLDTNVYLNLFSSNSGIQLIIKILNIYRNTEIS